MRIGNGMNPIYEIKFQNMAFYIPNSYFKQFIE